MISTEGSKNKSMLNDRYRAGRRAHIILTFALLLVSGFSLAIGPADVSIWSILKKLMLNELLTSLEYIIIFDIRLPRLLLGACVGAALAISGAVMQGLFRNPLADPGLIGISAGAGLGAIIAIVLGGIIPGFIASILGNYLVVFFAFLGGWATTLILYSVATRRGQTSVATMLLAGIALGALAGAISGILVYKANDQQLRDLTFWGLGSLAGASWAKVTVAGPLIGIAILFAARLGHGLNALALGEATAAHIGVATQNLKNKAIFTVAAATGIAVAVSGGIGFIGIVVPHLVRQLIGPDHRTLIVNSGLLGAIILVLADVISRIIVAPAELPIGIITAVIGAPVFLWILLSNRREGNW